MKRKLVTLFLALCCIFGFGAFTACVDPNDDSSLSQSESSTEENSSSEETHIHHFAVKKDSVYHWTACTCGETTEKIVHTFVEGLCECGAKEVASTQGLEYTLSDDETYYTVTGIGTITDTDIVIPSTYNNLPVTSIGDNAFELCDNLTSITIPDSITSIGDNAFVYCHNLTSITIPDSVTYIGGLAFGFCESLTEITIPDSVTSIETRAFACCKSLTSITIGKSVTFIGDNAVGGLILEGETYKLVEVINKSSLPITKGSDAYGGIAYYAKQVITDEKDSNIIKQNDYIFYNDNGSYYLLGYTGSQTNLTLPNNINGNNYAIYHSAFSRQFNNRLTSVTIPDSVTSIGNGAFEFCNNLTCIIIGNSVTSIGYSAFLCCSSLTSVTVGKNVNSIANNAFHSHDGRDYSDCHKLVEIVNKSSLPITERSDAYGGIAYYAKQVITDKQDSKIIKQNDYIFYNDNGSYYLLGYTGNQTNLTLPNNINGNNYAIYQYAFYHQTITFLHHYNLTSVTIPNSVSSIGQYAFYSPCGSLTSVTFENTNGWKVGNMAISSVDLADKEKAAEYLKNTYDIYNWTRSDE